MHQPGAQQVTVEAFAIYRALSLVLSLRVPVTAPTGGGGGWRGAVVIVVFLILY